MKAKAGFFLGFLLFAAGSLHAQQASLDDVIVQAGKAVEAKLAEGQKLAVLNFSSPSDAFSDYVIEELTGVLVMNGKLTVIERRSIDLIRKEKNVQLSGEVSDDSATAIGKELGAQGIVTGTLQDMGDAYRFRIKVINVETARIEAQVSYNLRNDRQVAFLLYGTQGSGSTVASGSAPTPAQNPGTRPAAAPAASPGTAPAPAAAPTPVPAASGSGAQSRPGLYVGNTFQGAMDLLDAIDWITLHVQDKGVYTIVLGRDQRASNISLNYGGKAVTVNLKASGGERKVSFDTNGPAVALFTIGPKVTFTLEDGVVMTGLKSYSRPFINVAGGTFIMKGGTLRDNKCSSRINGGGVAVSSGTFIMNAGTISGNIATESNGGGVYVDDGTFTMNGGTISGNRADNGGGGVYINRGTFTMNNGTIGGNGSYQGGGVYVNAYGGGTFTKSGTGGIIYGSNAPEGQANKSGREVGHAVFARDNHRENTARLSTALDSTKRGAEGGWE